MKLWIDDIRPAPEGYYWCKSVNEAMKHISWMEKELNNLKKNDWCYSSETFAELFKLYKVIVIDIDHDAGNYVSDGGDYIKLLDWLEETNRNYPIHIHSMNPVGVQNMRAIIRRNGWREV